RVGLRTPGSLFLGPDRDRALLGQLEQVAVVEEQRRPAAGADLDAVSLEQRQADRAALAGLRRARDVHAARDRGDVGERRLAARGPGDLRDETSRREGEKRGCEASPASHSMTP